MKKVRQFFFKNIGICVIGIIALLISISYIITYDMPDYFGIEPLYSWLHNLSISYIAAVIFYIVQVYIPEQRDSLKFKKALQSDFENLITFMEITILACNKHIEIKDKGADIIWNGKNEELYITYCKINYEKNKCNTKYTKSQILNLSKIFKGKIDKIKNNTLIKFCDYELLEKISELEKNIFYDSIASTIRFSKTEISMLDFKNKLANFEKIKNDLKQMLGIDVSYELLEPNDDDKYLMDLATSGNIDFLKDLSILNENILKNNIKNQILQIAKDENISISESDLESLIQQIIDNNKQK